MGNRYQELKERHAKEANTVPLGFAFSKEQFEETMRRWGLDPDKDLDKLYSIGFGGFIQIKDYPMFRDMLERHKIELFEAIISDRTGEGFIYDMFLYELRNHEYGYTGNDKDTIEYFGYTQEDIEANERLKKGLSMAKKKIWEEEE